MAAKRSRSSRGGAKPGRKSLRRPLSGEVSKPPTLEKVRKGFGLTREGFRRLSGFSVRVQADWEKGVRRPNEQATVRLSELERLQEALTRIMRPESLAAWLDTPNTAFDGLKPIEVIERGQSDRLWRMVFEIESGMPG